MGSLDILQSFSGREVPFLPPQYIFCRHVYMLYDTWILTTQQAHNVETTSIQRWFNVKTLNQRWMDVVSTSCACWVITINKPHWKNTADGKPIYDAKRQPAETFVGFFSVIGISFYYNNLFVGFQCKFRTELAGCISRLVDENLQIITCRW